MLNEVLQNCRLLSGRYRKVTYTNNNEEIHSEAQHVALVYVNDFLLISFGSSSFRNQSYVRLMSSPKAPI